MTGDRLPPLCLPLPGHRNPNSRPSAHEISILPSELQTYILTFTEVQLENDFFYRTWIWCWTEKVIVIPNKISTGHLIYIYNLFRLYLFKFCKLRSIFVEIILEINVQLLQNCLLRWLCLSLSGSSSPFEKD